MPCVGLSPGRGRLNLCCGSRDFPSQAFRASHSARGGDAAAQCEARVVLLGVPCATWTAPDPFSSQRGEQSPVFLWHRRDADGRLVLRERIYVRFCVISCFAE